MSLGREVIWISGCVGAGALFCYLAPDYGYSPMYFLAGCLYFVTGACRLLVRRMKDRG